MTDQDLSHNRRRPGEPMQSWAPRRDELARQLAGLAPAGEAELEARLGLLELNLAAVDAAVAARLGHVETRLAKLQDEIAAQLAALQAELVRTVALEDGRRFTLADRDQLALVMAMFVATRTGAAVDLPLSDGSVVEGLRAGELAEIARQLMEPQG